MTQTTSITLHPATQDDLEFLYEVYASTRQDELAVTPWTEQQKADFLRFQFNAQHTYYQQNYAGAEFDVILMDGKPIGRLYVYRTPGEIRLMDMALLPEYRGRGIGSAFMQSLIDESKRRGVKIGLHVEQYNPAYRLYSRLGFREVEVRGIYVYMVREPHHA